MQALDLDDKITIARVRIQEWYEHWDGAVYVSFSGGKDSTVLLHLVRSIYPDVPAVFCDTGLEYPEVREHVFSTPNVVILRPKIDFRSVIQKFGYPVISKEVSERIYQYRRGWLGKKTQDRCFKGINPDGSKSFFKFSELSLKLVNAPFAVSHKCCDAMKKQPFKKYEKETGRKLINGMIAEESLLRMTSYERYGCNAFDSKRPASRPLMTWTEQDVLRYINREGLEIPSVYGEIVPVPMGDDTAGQCEMFGDGRLMTTGCERTGCMFCMFGVHREKEPNRFQRMKITHPAIWRYCMKPWDEGGLGMKPVLDFLGVKYE